MSETKNNENNKKEKNEHEVYSVTYTKAGLASKNGESDDKEDETGGQKNPHSTENTPKISKEKSTEHDSEKPVH